jgi:hypothetical protein
VPTPTADSKDSKNKKKKTLHGIYHLNEKEKTVNPVFDKEKTHIYKHEK